MSSWGSARYKNYVPALIRTYITAWKASRDAAFTVDPYLRGEHPLPLASNNRTKSEEAELRKIASAPYGRLILRSCTQAIKLRGVLEPGSSDTPAIWKDLWLANRMDARQVGRVRSAIGFGIGYSSVLPGKLGLEGKDGVQIRNYTPKTMTAFFAEDWDEYPQIALNGVPQVDSDGQVYYMFEVFDDEAVHYAIVRDLHTLSPEEMPVTYLESRPHPSPVCPIVRHSPFMDDDGGSVGEIVPFLPILKRIDQTVYDRLVIQRQAAWQVRTAAGVKKPSTRSGQERMEAQMRAGDILTSDDAATKFSTLPASSMSDHTDVHESNLRDLASTSQTPPYMLTGQTDNMAPEALAAIISGYQQKIEDYKTALGVSYRQEFELAAHIDPSLGSYEEGLEPRWFEFRPYSLTQSADALGKLAQQLEIPADQLFEYVPFFSDFDVERARAGRQEEKDEALAMAQAQAAASAAEAAQNQSRALAADSRQSGR